MPDFCHQAGDVAVVPSGERRHLAIRRLDATAGEDEFARHEAVTLVAAAEQHLWHALGAVDEDEGRGIARFQVWKSLVADGLGQPLDPVGCDAALDRRVSTGATHYMSVSLLAPAAMFSASALEVAELRPGRRLLSSLLLESTRMAHELETQGAGDRRCFDQFHGHRIAEPMGFRVPDEGAAAFVETKIFVADEARRDESVGAGVVELDEQAGAGDAGNMAVEGRADPIGEKMRDQPVSGLALGLHGAALRDGKAWGHL